MPSTPCWAGCQRPSLLHPAPLPPQLTRDSTSVLSPTKSFFVKPLLSVPLPQDSPPISRFPPVLAVGGNPKPALRGGVPGLTGFQGDLASLRHSHASWAIAQGLQGWALSRPLRARPCRLLCTPSPVLGCAFQGGWGLVPRLGFLQHKYQRAAYRQDHPNQPPQRAAGQTVTLRYRCPEPKGWAWVGPGGAKHATDRTLGPWRTSGSLATASTPSAVAATAPSGRGADRAGRAAAFSSGLGRRSPDRAREEPWAG